MKKATFERRTDILDFSVNVNALGPPPGFIDFLRNEIKQILYYPDYTNREARKALSVFTGLSPAHLTVGVGATELLFLTPPALQIEHAIVIVPTFWEYATAMKRFSRIENVSFFLTRAEKNFMLPFDQLREQIQQTEAIFLCNPNNPTSVIVDRDELLSFVANHPETMFIIDETYLLFRSDYTKQTMLTKICVTPNLLVVTSLSKFFAIPGLRLGFLSGSPEIIERFRALQIPYTLNRLAQIALPFLLQAHEYMKETRIFYTKERRRFHNMLQAETGGLIQCLPPEANFILAHVVNGWTSTKLASRLKEKNILIRDCKEFIGLDHYWIRFSIKQQEENNTLIRILHELQEESRDILI